MKLQILKTFNLANPKVSRPHWKFKEGQVIETDNAYLSSRLLELECAQEYKGKKMKESDKNKMADPALNKAM